MFTCICTSYPLKYVEVYILCCHDDVIKHFPRYWHFVRGIHRSPVNSPHKCQWRGALMFSLIWASTNGWANNGDVGNFGRHRTHYGVTVIVCGKAVTKDVQHRSTPNTDNNTQQNEKRVHKPWAVLQFGRVNNSSYYSEVIMTSIASQITAV